MSDLGDYIRTVRERRGLEVQDLASEIGRYPSWVSELERGRRKTIPEPEELRSIAGSLGVSVVDLLIASGYLTRDDVYAAQAERNPFPTGTSSHELVDRLLGDDRGLVDVVDSIMALTVRADGKIADIEQESRD